MTTAKDGNGEFISQLKRIILEHISDEQFGVSELAGKVNMSRSNLLRKVKKDTQLSVNQFIRNIRLEEGSRLLSEGSLNVTEVSYHVGFGSPSYFVKCFREYYGFPPGELGKQKVSKTSEVKVKSSVSIIWILIPSALLLILLLLFWNVNRNRKADQEKSIAVLPFINESSDSSNLYLINGLMESVLNNLQRIEDLRVLSRTSTEKFRNNPVPVKQISEELDVRYLVEGSGQKVGNWIMLNIQLIDARTDTHLWSRQYKRELRDIFELQSEIAKSIAAEVKAIITPEENKRIDKMPTNNYIAYDYFLKGMEELRRMNGDGLLASFSFFQQAIKEDPDFSLPYAFSAIAYYYLDINQTEKIFLDSLNYYADKALLLDSEISYNLLAKGLYYLDSGNSELALPYLEKAHAMNPNELYVLNLLTDYYTNREPDTEKYLEYALKGLRLGKPEGDSTNISIMYLHLGNAFIQSGFTYKAKEYIQRSLDYDQNNLFSWYVKAYIDYTDHLRLGKLKEDLLAVLDMDQSRLDVMQEVAKIYYYERDFENARKFYDRFNAARDAYSLNIFPYENVKIAVVYDKVGEEERSKKYFDSFLETIKSSQSVYRQLNFAVYYAYHNEIEKALEALETFSEEGNFQYWIVLFLDMDPLVDSIRDTRQYKDIFEQIKSKFWESHERIKDKLEEEGLL